MSKIYDASRLMQVDFPKIAIGDKLFTVNNLKTTMDAYRADLESQDSYGKEIDILLKHTLGDLQIETLNSLNLSQPAYNNFLIYIQAALQDITFEEAEKQAKTPR